MNKRFSRTVALSSAVVLFLTLFSGCYFLPQEEEMLAPPLKQPEAVTYKTYTVQEGVIERWLTASGKFESTESEVLFYTATTGRLKDIYVKAGDEVKAGDLIVELDTGDLEYTIYRQEKAVRQAELALELAKKPDEVAIARATINLDLAQREIARTREEREKTYNKIARESLDESIYKQEQNIKLLELTLEQAQPDAANIERAQIAYDLSTAQLAVYNQQLANARLYATMDGLVTYVANLEPGDSVSTYTSLVKIANSDSLRITFSTNDYHELTVGTELDISYTGKNGFTTIGRVVQLPTDVPVTSPDSERTAVKVEVDEKPDDASIGTSVNISLLLERKEGCIVLPIRYVSTYSSRRYVRILNDDGIPEERDVKLGIQNVSEVEIVSGLEAGDVIVI